MVCNNCGKENLDTIKTCVYCKKKLNDKNRNYDMDKKEKSNEENNKKEVYDNTSQKKRKKGILYYFITTFIIPIALFHASTFISILIAGWAFDLGNCEGISCLGYMGASIFVIPIWIISLIFYFRIILKK